MIGIRLGTLFFFFMLAASPSFSSVARRDFFVESDHGIRLFVREVSQSVTPSPKGARSQPILLIHGARVPGLASFDVPVAGGSLAEDFAKRGFDVFIVDLRGYGKSTRASGMDEPPSAHSPLVRSNEAVRDIAAVVAGSAITAVYPKSPCSVGRLADNGRAITPAYIQTGWPR